MTSEQALADYAYLIKDLKSKRPDLESSPVIALGGSYGGMLSAWFRMKYPNVVTGALAASAPVWQFVTECSSFLTVVTNAFKKADEKCPKVIQSSWEILNEYGKTKQGLKQLKEVFRLCDPLESVKDLKDWLSEIYGDVSMANYPYATNFLSPLPAWPVGVMCANITEGFNKSGGLDPLRVLEGIYKGVNVYQNYTGESKCFDIGTSTPFDINMVSWEYQTCTEFVFPFCSNGVTDMFEVDKWDFKEYSKDCFDKYKTVPRDEWPSIHYGSSYRDIYYFRFKRIEFK